MNKKSQLTCQTQQSTKGESTQKNTNRQKNLVRGLKNEDKNEKLANRIVVNVKMVHDGACVRPKAW